MKRLRHAQQYVLTGALLAISLLGQAALAQQPADGNAAGRVLIVVGPSTHPPGTHEVTAGGRLLKHCIENAENVRGLKADLVEAWPLDKKILEAASTVVFIGDIFPPVRLPD